MLKGTPNDTEDPDRAAREEQEEDDAAKAPRGKGPKAKAKSKAKGKAKAKAVQKEDEEEEVEGKDRAEGSMIPRKRMLKRKKSIRRQLTYGENDMTKDAETPKESPKKKVLRRPAARKTQDEEPLTTDIEAWIRLRCIVHWGMLALQFHMAHMHTRTHNIDGIWCAIPNAL